MTRKFTGDQILIATHNAGKLKEMAELFAPFGVRVVGAAEMKLDEPEETEDNFIGNARIKAFVMAMTKTHNLLEEKNAPHPRRARFCATLVLAWPDGHEEIFEGRANGTLVWPMRGEIGHGYDPMFQPDGYDQTFGEMSHDEKNKISHRADAFTKLTSTCFD